MKGHTMQSWEIQRSRMLVRLLGWYAVIGCALFILSVLIADFVVPDHDWISDTISDLGAGEYEYIVDIGLYAFSASLISVALLTAHVPLGGRGWHFAVIGFALLGLIVFLVGARNEYGDSDNEGWVIHSYLVYGIGALMTALPLLTADGASRVNKRYRPAFFAIAGLWTVSAPLFFVLPTAVDGVYERYLGVIAIIYVCVMAQMFLSLREDQI